MRVENCSLHKLQQIADGVAFRQIGKFVVIDFLALHIFTLAQLVNDLSPIVLQVKDGNLDFCLFQRIHSTHYLLQIGNFVDFLKQMLAPRCAQTLIETGFVRNGCDDGDGIVFRIFDN